MMGLSNYLERAVSEKCVLLDKSSWGVLSVTGKDRLRFLHNQLTNAFENAKPGSVLQASYTTATGRTIDLVTCFIQEEEVLVLSPPNRYKQLLESFNKYIFPLDRVKVSQKDVGSICVVLGPLASKIITKGMSKEFGGGEASMEMMPTSKQFITLPLGQVKDWSALVAHETGLALPGMIVISTSSAVEALRKAAQEEQGSIVGGEKEWQMLRIIQGRPYPDKELTKDITPLEAGLFHSVDFEKGCYLGQETIAKVANNQGERQKLYGVRIKRAEGGALQEGKKLLDKQGGRAGIITSVLEDEPSIGLAYIRKIVKDPLNEVLLMEDADPNMEIEVREIPYATRAITTTVGRAIKKEDSIALEEKAAAALAEAERKAKKLEEMRKKLEAFQQKIRRNK